MESYRIIKPFNQRNQPTFTTRDGPAFGTLIDEVEVEDEYRHEDGTFTMYKYLVQQINWEYNNSEEFRFCYYFSNKDLIEEDYTKWNFHQGGPSVSVELLQQLFDKMKDSGWIH